MVARAEQAECLITDRVDAPLHAPLLVLRVDTLALRGEVLARVERIGAILEALARTPSASTVSGPELRLADALVDLANGTITRGGELTRLTPIEVAVVRRLWAARGQYVARRTLEREVWGYAEGARTRTVLSTMHRLRGKLEPNASAPRYLQSDRQRGYRLVVSSRPVEVAAAAPFIGRAPELAAVEGLIGDGQRLVVLVGVGGVGKTRLAREVAARAQPGRDVIWCDCAGVEDVVGLGASLARALSCAVPSARAELTLRVALAARQRPLVVLDDLDRGVAAARSLLADPLGLGVGVQILATSREALRLADEQRVVVPVLEPEAARALFAAHLRNVRPELAPELAEAEDLELTALVAACEGVPLALELTAQLARFVPLGQLADGLGERLRTQALGADPRHSNLESALELSWELLGPEQRQLMARLSALPGGFDFADVEALCEPRGAAFERLAELTDKSLVTAQGDGRFGALGLVREHALARAPEEVARTVAWSLAQAEHFERASRAGLAKFGEALAGYRSAGTNLDWAARWAIEHDPPLAERLLHAMWALWLAVGPFAVGLELCEALLRVRATAGLGVLRARLLVYMGEDARALEHLREVLAAGFEGETEETEAIAYDLLAGLLPEGEERRQARERADLIFGGGPAGRAERHESRAAEAWAAGRIAEALAETEAADRCFAEIGHGKRQLVQRINRGSHLRDLGRSDEALRVLSRAQAESAQIRFGMGEVYAGYILAHAYADVGERGLAATTFGATAALGRRQGSLAVAARAAVWEAIFSGERDTIEGLLTGALAATEEIGDTEARLVARGLLAAIRGADRAALTAEAAELPPMVRAPIWALLGLPADDPEPPSALVRSARGTRERLGLG